MTISFSGVGSGLPVSEMIDAIMAVERQPVDRLYTEQSTLTTAKSTLSTMGSKLSSLRTAVEKFTDGNLASVFDLFKKRTTSSSDTAIASVTASNNSAIQTVTLKVNNLATPTVAQSINSPGSEITGDEYVKDLGNGSAVVTVTDEDTDEEVGTTFSIYVDNKKYTINLDDTTTLNKADDENSIVNQINAIEGGGLLTASIQDGKFVIDVADDGTTHHDVKLGSTSDTSNFVNIMQLNTVTNAVDEEGNPISNTATKITSDNQISAINTYGTIVGTDATAKLSSVVTAGSFTIGKETFTIDENTTLSNLIASINSSKDANVVAVFDVRTNKLKLTSKDPGATNINLSNDNLEGDATEKSNFLSVMGLTTDDNTLASGAQTLGKNASVELNGNTLEANTNTLGSDITGMYGVTIKLNGTTPSTTNGTTTVELSISQDTDSIATSLSDLITKFNNFTDEVDTDTASTGDLKYDYTLIRLKNELKMNLMNTVDGLSDYDSLVSIGVNSGAVGTSVDTSTNSYSLDKDTFLEALNDNPDEVRTLLIGDKDKGITGILQILNDKLDTALDPVNGYVKTKTDSINTQLTSIAKSIEDGEARLKSRQETLTQQYTQMDQEISAMKAQTTSFGIY